MAIFNSYVKLPEGIMMYPIFGLTHVEACKIVSKKIVMLDFRKVGMCFIVRPM